MTGRQKLRILRRTPQLQHNPAVLQPRQTERRSAEPHLVQRALVHPSPATLTPAVLRTLQQTHGNKFVQRLVDEMAPARLPGLPSPVQAAAQNLALSERDDRFEHEAERVARQVMGMVSQVPDTVNPDKPGRQAGAGQPIQRQEARPDKEPEDTTQHQEEDALGTSKYIEESAAQAKQQPVGPMLVQLKANDVGAADLPGHIEQAIVEARGQGRPLPPRAMGQMERAFGADFSAVRIHDDDRADMLAREIDAKAFTNGKEIFFRDGEYNPGSMDGQQLIAHELAHVVQQGAGSVDAPQRRGDPHKELVQRR